MKSLKRIVFIIGIIALFCGNLAGQSIKSMEFRNQEISDILLVLASASGTSIIPDETVTGTASYYFTDMDFEKALSLFLATYDYFYTVKDGVYYVSRISAEYDGANNLVTLEANNTNIQMIVNKLSQTIGQTILYDVLPNEKITIQVNQAGIFDVLNILVRKFPDYNVIQDKGYFYIQRDVPNTTTGASPSRDLFKASGNVYSASFKQTRFKEALISLFETSGIEYSLLGTNDNIIETFDFSNKSFEEILELLLIQGNSDYQVIDGIYYIFDIERRDVLKRFYATTMVPLSYISVSDLPSLIPAKIASSDLIKIDKNNNAVILNGTLEEISPILDFIELIDKPTEGKQYHQFSLKYIDIETLSELLPEEMILPDPILLKESSSFIMLLSEEKNRELTNFLAKIDVEHLSYPINLKYIRGEDLMEAPPPSADKEEITLSTNPNIVYFTGSENKYKRVMKDLDMLDKPIPQIRYEVLVMQIQEAHKLNWDFSLAPSISDSDSETAFLGELGNVLNLNFDIVTQFGYQFALDLNLSLSNSEAKVMADTSLNALSGESTSFQNTSTYRYYEYTVDPDSTTTVRSSETQEITSGLTIAIQGWTSGEGMITMEVETTISKQDDTSSTSDEFAIPSTSEKVVKTHIRTESGKPVIIGGLMQQDVTTAEKKVPILGDIPLLGYLFRNEYTSTENSEMVVTIVPYIEYSETNEDNTERDIENLYNKFVRR